MFVPMAGGLEFDTWMFGKAVEAGFNTFRFFAVGALAFLPWMVASAVCYSLGMLLPAHVTGLPRLCGLNPAQ